MHGIGQGPWITFGSKMMRITLVILLEFATVLANGQDYSVFQSRIKSIAEYGALPDSAERSKKINELWSSLQNAHQIPLVIEDSVAFLYRGNAKTAEWTGDFNGWGTDAVLIKNPSNPYKYSGKLTFTSTGMKFRADGAWATSWGGSFPTGTGTTNGDPNISVPAGNYQITFNSLTGEYSFTL